MPDSEMSSNLVNFVKAGKKIVAAAANYNSLLALQKVEKPKDPVLFLKPTTSYIVEGQDIIIPKGWKVNEEVELGIIIGKHCKNVDETSAMDYVGGYCVALDMTSTSELGVARSKGWPWTMGKGFDTACPVSRLIKKDEIPNPHDVNLWCDVNGVQKQAGNTNDLTFTVPELISYASKFMTLEPNDMILTGSPPGMGPVVHGDVIEGGIKDLVHFKFNVKEEQ
ncbi:acylpyruvase FAHD1, mitochondrial [Atheta coriaria]|uniref:acylpyruvase FAHD1, mitochondrial n=1 Tax=Dalotia coriaria TaxID=877792 RepID=UPI0031F34210